MADLSEHILKKPIMWIGVALVVGALVTAVVYDLRSPAGHPSQEQQAASQPFQPQSVHGLAECIVGASTVYQVPVDVILGIISVEGGHLGQTAGPNSNGTYDLGLMQINSLWVPQLAQLWQVDYRTAYGALRDSGCENVYVGTWILKQKIAETGSLYNGIAYYHSATRGPGTAYANRVVMMMGPQTQPVAQ
jgi:soluble lytic murein transglycosylase-like protein